jgi:hypothetical protein
MERTALHDLCNLLRSRFRTKRVTPFLNRSRPYVVVATEARTHPVQKEQP